jgi:NAD(P)-dependent dehydrogenase (short-subunit alcohol dehydrogenase family)
VNGLDGLDILVSNAGRQQSHSSILDISIEQFDWRIKTNIYAPLLDYQGCLAAFAARIGDHWDHFRAGLRPVT